MEEQCPFAPGARENEFIHESHMAHEVIAGQNVKEMQRFFIIH
jgi:hypothetical protein